MQTNLLLHLLFNLLLEEYLHKRILNSQLSILNLLERKVHEEAKAAKYR